MGKVSSINFLKICFAVGVFVVLNNQNVLADTPTPTLDRVKAQQSAFLNTDYSTYSLTEVIDDVTAPEGAITVNIEGKGYFYTTADNKDVLQLLSSTGSTALIETTQDKALYTTPEGKYYTYDTNKLKDSAYTLTEATSADDPNTITLYDKKEVVKYFDMITGKEVSEADRLPDVEYKEITTIESTPKYYTVSLKQTEYGNSNGNLTLTFGWQKNADTGNLEFKQNQTSPVGQTITYKYSESDFSKIETHLLDKGAIEVSSNSGYGHKIIEGGAAFHNTDGSTLSVDNALFKDNTAIVTFIPYGLNPLYMHMLGGAVYNAGDIRSISGAFINNSVRVNSLPDRYTMGTTYAKGGAIANVGTISNINSIFIANYIQITGKFNSFVLGGGAIYNEGTIESFIADFIGNYIQQTTGTNSSGIGGAIYNEGVIESIIGDFIGNKVQSVGAYYSSAGGAIYNTSTIESIIGDFISNYIQDRSTRGGAIYNGGGLILMQQLEMLQVIL